MLACKMNFLILIIWCINHFLNSQEITNPTPLQDSLNQQEFSTNQMQEMNTTPITIVDQMLLTETTIETTTKDTAIIAIIFRDFKDFKKSGFNLKKS